MTAAIDFSYLAREHPINAAVAAPQNSRVSLRSTRATNPLAFA
jgi:hypothetical protein